MDEFLYNIPRNKKTVRVVEKNITKIEGLGKFAGLKKLYLSKNKIKKMENLDMSIQLEKCIYHTTKS
jgi:hypothetical protein